MKKKLQIILGILVLIGFLLQGIFGVAIFILLAGIIGCIIGIYKKEKSIWQVSLIILIVNIICIALFVTLLINSNM